MEDKKVAYAEDPRIPCRYGRKCYQKNPIHHNKYKHPINPKRKTIFSDSEKETKKTKLNSLPRDSSNHGIINGLCHESPEVLLDQHDASEVTENINKEFEVAVNNDVSESDSDAGEECVESYCNKEDKNLVFQDEEMAVQSFAKPISKVCTYKNDYNYVARKFIKEKFLFEMPEDFYEFFKFCENLNPKNPSEAFSSVGLKLIGPFDVLIGKFSGINLKDETFLIHWRYFYDPPQMQTVIKGDDKTGYHIGYFRDSPLENPVFMVETFGLKDGVLAEIGENIFAAVSLYLEERKKTADPFNKVHFMTMASKVKKEAERLGLDLSRRTKNMTKRDNKILSRTLNKIGLVVPYNRKTQLGYRKLAMSEKDLGALLTYIQKALPEQKQKLLGDLQSELLTWTDIACDECDFGTGIELGWNIICHGVEDLNNTAARFLSSNFRQLKWDSFARIAEVHMSHRKKGCDLSVI